MTVAKDNTSFVFFILLNIHMNKYKYIWLVVYTLARLLFFSDLLVCHLVF